MMLNLATFMFLVQPNVVGGSIKKDDGRTKTALKSTESSSQLSKEETVVANKKSDVSSSKIIPMQQEKPQPHRPTNFFERLTASYCFHSAYLDSIDSMAHITRILNRQDMHEVRSIQNSTLRNITDTLCNNLSFRIDV